MNSCDMILKSNTQAEKISYLKAGCLRIKQKSERFDDSSLRKLLNKVNSAIKQYKEGLKRIVIEFGKVEFKEKLTYILLETMCYSLIRDYNIGVSIEAKKFVTKNIFRGGIKGSPLNYLIQNKDHAKGFLEAFERKIDGKYHYRRIIRGTEKKNSKIFGDIMTEIRSFLRVFCEDEQYRKDVSEVVIELAGNAWEHTQSDCLIDIDIKDNCTKRNFEQEGKFYGINIVVLNYSDILLGNALEKKILECPIKESAQRYMDVKDAYEFHKTRFSPNYDGQDFFVVASFQDKISGRPEGNIMGGRGLTKLIRSLEKQSEIHSCYVMSGNHVLWFKLKYIEYNEEGWIGFNNKSDFFHGVPNKECIGRRETYIPGTAFNLNFAMKEEKQNGKQSD